MKYTLVAIGIFLASTLSTHAQQDAQFTQYIYNTIAINPAYAGSRGVLSMNLMHRSQWIGLDGAPKTQTLSLNAPVGRGVGVGLSIVNDEIGNGASQNTYFDGDFSYTLQLGDDRNLSFGIKAGGHLLNLDFTRLRNYIPNAMDFGTDQSRKFAPNIGAGIYYYTNKFYAGLSVPNFIETKHFADSGATASYLAENRMNLYFMTGYVFELNSDLLLKPALLMKGVKGAPLQVDVSASVLFNEKFSLGLAYRWDAAISATFAFQITDQILLGLAYDRETTALGATQFNDGSFEIIARFELSKVIKNLIHPRFF